MFLHYSIKNWSYFIFVKEYEAEHGPTPNDDVEMENTGIGKSGSSSETGTPRGQDSGSVSPNNDSNTTSSLLGVAPIVSKSVEGSVSEDKLDSAASWGSQEDYDITIFIEILIIIMDSKISWS